jgi:hypothetical protein
MYYAEYLLHCHSKEDFEMKYTLDEYRQLAESANDIDYDTLGNAISDLCDTIEELRSQIK